MPIRRRGPSMGNFLLVVILAVMACALLLVELSTSRATNSQLGTRRLSGAQERGDGVVKVVYLPLDTANELLLGGLVNSLDKNETDPLVRSEGACSPEQRGADSLPPARDRLATCRRFCGRP